MINNNEWLIINSIIYKINAIEDFDEMRYKVLEMIGFIVDYDSGTFWKASTNKKELLENYIGFNVDNKVLDEYKEKGIKDDYGKGLMYSGKNMAYRESDIMPDEMRIQTQYYKNLYAEKGYHYSAHINISYQEEFLGEISLFRNKEKPNFSNHEISILDILKDHLALKLFQETQKQEKLCKNKISIPEFKVIYVLTNRECDVLDNMMTDKSADEIAEKLSISINTLRKHINSIYNKANINSRIQLIDMVNKDQ